MAEVGVELIGVQIKNIRKMTEEEMEAEGWSDWRPTSVIELANGILIYSSRDDEGNGPGVLFGMTPEGIGFDVLGGGEYDGLGDEG